MTKKKSKLIWGFEAGSNSPQMKIQIRPLCWCIGFNIERKAFQFGLGPIAIGFWWAKNPWHVEKI
jgi:hypothetical protein